MLRSGVTMAIIFSVFVISSHGPAFAQSNSELRATAAPQSVGIAKKRPDLKRVLDEETRKFENASVEFDPLKYDNEIRKEQAKKGWSKRDKIGLGLFIAGMAVLVVLLINYGKECIRSSPAKCTPGVDEFCTCEEYEQRK